MEVVIELALAHGGKMSARLEVASRDDLKAKLALLHAAIPAELRPDARPSVGAVAAAAAAEPVRYEVRMLPVSWVERKGQSVKFGGGEYQKFGVIAYDDTFAGPLEVVTEGRREVAAGALVMGVEFVDGKPKRVISCDGLRRWAANADVPPDMQVSADDTPF